MIGFFVFKTLYYCIFEVYMKATTFILSILMLVLALKPCSDGDNEEHLDDMAIEKNHDHSKDIDDSCASMCICYCCGVTITFDAPKYYDIEPSSNISTEISNVYISKYTFAYLSNIWQPPQMLS